MWVPAWHVSPCKLPGTNVDRQLTGVSKIFSCPTYLKFLYKALSKRCPSLTRYPTVQSRQTKEHVMKHWTSTAIRKIKRPMPPSTDRRNGLWFRWGCVSMCFIWGSSEYVGTTFSFKPILNPYPPTPTYSKILQSLLVDRSIAQDLKDGCGAKMPFACFFLTEMDKGAFYNFETCIERSYPIIQS